ncbi:MAG TPA: Gfo/Idh/MocA family oxidoreductase [Bryobacteraceae bacterium]|jgi:predicted dehydrogenase|nr:Gfo/Idh/MocA family oxidoreductase [Bryobacteraceae bacterium]
MQSRRIFLENTGKGLIVGAMLHSRDARAAPRRPQRVAVIGAGHYHATLPPNYLRILQNEKLDIVGIHDPDRAVAEDRAKRCGSTAYTDYRVMIDKTKPEFVLSLNRHVDMPGPFRFLVDTGIPFLAEKPWGIDDKTVNELADYAEKKKAWATAPMSFRYSWWAQIARKMVQSGEMGTISHMLVRFNQPGIQRYIDEGSSWMLSKATAGGGALLNLGIHGFDLCRYITGEEPRVVSAVTSHSIWKRDIEDYAFVTLRTPSGMVFLNEASYTFPTTGSDSERKIAAAKVLVRATNTGDGVQIIGPGRDEILKAPPDFVGSWPGVVKDCLDRIGRGEPPPASVRDCARAVSLTFDAYHMAKE